MAVTISRRKMMENTFARYNVHETIRIYNTYLQKFLIFQRLE